MAARRSVSVVGSLVCLLAAGLLAFGPSPSQAAEDKPRTQASDEEKAMTVHYLEIVTPDVDKTCVALGKAHSVEFGEPISELGNARTASIAGGGRIGVRGPLRGDEEPVVRPYVLVEDLTAAVEAAKAAGAEIALPSMEIPGQGTIAIYTLGGIEHGLWQE